MTTERLIHEGRNVKRIREMLGIKQDALALELGDDWNQKKISLLEQKESIEPATLEEVAKALKVPVEALKNFDEQSAINVFSSSFHDNSSIFNSNCILSINPLEKWIEAIEENKKLYEALMKEKDDKITMLEGLLKAR